MTATTTRIGLEIGITVITSAWTRPDARAVSGRNGPPCAGRGPYGDVRSKLQYVGFPPAEGPAVGMTSKRRVLPHRTPDDKSAIAII